jgi:hypothetical protein
VIIYVATDNGRIKIVVDGPPGIVAIDDDLVRIEGLNEPITLRAGLHELTVTRGVTEVETHKFIVRRGDNVDLCIEYQPKLSPSGVEHSAKPSRDGQLDKARTIAPVPQANRNPFDTAVVDGSNTADARGASPAAERIRNSSCEEPIVGSKIPHWEVVDGAWLAGKEVEAVDGLAYFTPGKVGHAELSQNVYVGDLAREIDQGNKQFVFTAYVRSFRESSRPADLSRIAIDFFDESKTNLLHRFDTGNICSQEKWQEINSNLVAPKGTRWIQVRLISRRRSGTDCDAWYDKLSLTPLVQAGESVQHEMPTVERKQAGN